MKLRELAEFLNYDIQGNADIEVSKIMFSDEADEQSIAIIRSSSEIESTKACVILMEPAFVITDKTLLFSYEDIITASVRIAQLLIEEGYYPDYSQGPSYKFDDNIIAIGKNTIIGNNTKISPFVMIGDDVRIGSNCVIETGVYIGNGVVVGDNVILHSSAKIGTAAFYHHNEENQLITFAGIGVVKLDNYVEIGCNSIIQRGTFSDTTIGQATKIGNLIDIGHDVKIGSNCKIVSQTGIAGNVKIGNSVFISGQVAISNYSVIEDYVTVKPKTNVTKRIKKGSTVSGFYARDHREELKLRAKIRRLL